jgi:hypothetical protein
MNIFCEAKQKFLMKERREAGKEEEREGWKSGSKRGREGGREGKEGRKTDYESGTVACL